MKMTIKEAIEVLTANIMIACDRAQFSSSCKEMVENALDMAIAALEKQDGKKPLYSVMYPVLQEYDMFQCPACGQDLFYSISNGQDWYCRDCGQKIDWTKGE